MKRTDFSLEVFGDRFPTQSLFAEGDNSKKLSVMKKALKQAMQTELTDRQRDMVIEYYYGGATVTAVAEKFGVTKSTVSRHLKRARERLKRALKYGMYVMWTEED
jgi:RNA polymerase sigma factor (sigma-70 family)